MSPSLCPCASWRSELVLLAPHLKAARLKFVRNANAILNDLFLFIQITLFSPACQVTVPRMDKTLNIIS